MTVVNIEITDDGKIMVKSEYNPLFVQAARKLGGKWFSPHWVFDSRDEDDVRGLCLEVYGCDGLTEPELVSVQVTIPEDCNAVGGRQDSIYLFGRIVARAWGRDSGAKLGEGVVVKKGNFSSGGSAKNWNTSVEDGTVFILRDVPKTLVEKHDNEAFVVEIIEEQVKEEKNEKKESLIAEKEALLKRLLEIDSALYDLNK